MTLSIVICTYNSKSNIEKTLNSILSQNFNDYEIIVVDGLSQDNTIEIVKGFEKKFKNKLNLISEKDNGIYDAMNKGIALAKGEWLYFLGSGDIFADSAVLKDVSNAIEKYSDDEIVYGDVLIGDSERIYGGEFTKEQLILKNISHQSIFFKKTVFEKLGQYKLKYKTLADWEFNMRWMNDDKIEKTYISRTIAQLEQAGASANIFDKSFYTDFETNIKKYFPAELQDFYKQNKKKEIDFVKSKLRWKLWKWKNKFTFAFCNTDNFIKKYTKK